METPLSLAKRFREVILNGTLVANTNFKDELENSDWQFVTSRVGSLNTIAALAQHIHYYIKGMNVAFKNGTLDIKDKFSFDFPPVISQSEWETFLILFLSDAEEFADFVGKMPQEQLDRVFIDEKYGTYERNINVMIEHSYYHLGQITLIAKLLRSGDIMIQRPAAIF